jgi:hypothetical protein
MEPFRRLFVRGFATIVSCRHPLVRVLLLIVFGSTTVFAGPPFLTDDPEPVPWHHYEAYLFSTVDRGLDTSSWVLPAVEFNMGAAPNLQLHVVIPGAYLTPQGALIQKSRPAITRSRAA